MTPTRVGQLGSTALVVVSIIVLLVIPSYGDRRLIEVNGYAVLLVLAIPLIISSVTLFVDGRLRRPVNAIAAVLLLVFSFLASATIGYFFVPAALVLLVVAVWPRLWRAEHINRNA